MKMKHRALALILTLMMVLTYMPALAFADDEFSGNEISGGAISVGETKEVTIDEEYAYYSFTFTPAESGRYVFYSSGHSDTYGEVYEEDEYLGRNDDGGTESNFEIDFDAVEGNTYYLHAAFYGSGTGSYEVSLEADDGYGDWWIDVDSGTEWMLPGDKIWVYGGVDNDNARLQYQWLKDGKALTNWTDLPENAFYDGDEFELSYVVNAIGTYTFNMRELSDGDEVVASESSTVKVYFALLYGNVEYWPRTDTTAVAYSHEIYDPTLDTEVNLTKGNISVLGSVKFSDGKTRTVDTIRIYGPDITSITIPATVTSIGEGLGLLYYDNWSDTAQKYTSVYVRPGFTIFGTSGTAAQRYANKYGITFRDPQAEAAAAERARQGTPDSKIPKVKGVKKPTAKKTSITVKWTKLTSKQQKKAKATKYEIWVCPNKAFGAADTKIKMVSKSKSSAKITGLKKNTKYYVKVRAIRMVGSTKYVGKWSARKTIKTPKK